MRQRIVWFVLGILVGSLFLVSALPQRAPATNDGSQGKPISIPGIPTVVSELRGGDFVLVDSDTLKSLVNMGVLPYAPVFRGNTVYAVKILPDGKFFIYAGPNVRDPFRFLEEARGEFSKIDWSRDVTLKVEPLNFSWQVRINGESKGTYTPEAASTVSARVEGIIEWSSHNDWKPYGKLKLVWEVYKLADVDPRNDYRVVDMKTYVWSGHYLYGDSGVGKWQIDTVKVIANVKPDGNDVFDLADFGPSHEVNRYNSKSKSTISYTIGTGGISVTIEQVIKLFSIDVDTNGDWVRWTYTFNRDEKESYADSWVKLEPGYQCIAHIPSSPTTAHQKLTVSVKWTHNRPYWFDDHFTGTVGIDWIWHFG